MISMPLNAFKRPELHCRSNLSNLIDKAAPAYNDPAKHCAHMLVLSRYHVIMP
jgi:hypothetical protein